MTLEAPSSSSLEACLAAEPDVPVQSPTRKTAAPRHSPTATTPLVVAVASRKGGVGKTTLSVLLTVAYRRAGKSVIAVDLDPQGSLGLAFGVSGPQNAGGTAAILSRGAIEDGDLTTIEDGLSIAASGPDLEPLLGNVPDLGEVLASARADVIVLDCPPGYTQLDRSAMAGADVVLTVAEPHRLALAGARRALAEAESLPSPPRRALVLGRLDARRSLDRQAPELLAGAFSEPIFIVPQDAALAVAMNAGRLPGRSRAMSAVMRIIDWIEGGKR